MPFPLVTQLKKPDPFPSRDIIASMKNLVAVLCVVAILLAAADLWSRVAVVHAQRGGQVYVDGMGLTNRAGGSEVQIRGSSVVGFSCLIDSTGSHSCFVASQ